VSLEELQRFVSPFISYVGAELQDGQEGVVRFRIDVAPHHTNPLGVMHGGAMATLLDEATAIAVNTLLGWELEDRARPLLVEMNVSYLAAARPGDQLLVEGRVLRRGRQVAFAEAEARRHPDGGVIAKGRFTFVIPQGRSGE